MSHQATKWALRQRGLKPAAKIVLFYLCDHHNDENGCFPSQELLATECEMSRSTLNLQLAKLEEMGLLRRHSSIDERTKRQRPTQYILLMDGPPKGSRNDESRVRKSDNAVSENGTRSVSEKQAEPCPKNDESRVRKSDTNPVREPLNEPKSCASARDAGPEEGRVLKMRLALIEAMGLTGAEMNTSGTFIVQKMAPADLELSLDVWSREGLTDDQIVAAVRAKVQGEKLKDPGFIPRSARLFDGPIHDHALRLKRPAASRANDPQTETPEQRQRRYRKMIGG
ncbi:helix-turn-helix domain-containing protein [Paracoccus hibiscisoli]|uniref:helix-turn-helix domain-containing protein n=1 Tax=Paracoccus hibiscisoli TaxID=2023261 RepID=UPI0023F3B951|nr:helix-turn-helix domain-containing protein [Paracoccus hibiscisoli]